MPVSPDKPNKFKRNLVWKANKRSKHICTARAKLKAAGIVNFITAGGETSSIVVQQLGFTGFQISKQLPPGVPWLKALDEDIYLALKSGNFRTEDFCFRTRNLI